MSEAFGNNKKGAFDLEHQKPVPQATSGVPQPASAVYVAGQGAKEPLPCMGLGIGWTLFIAGFFFGIPWYVGAALLCCGTTRKDKREKGGCVACLVLAVILTIVIIIQIALTATAASELAAQSHHSYGGWN